MMGPYIVHRTSYIVIVMVFIACCLQAAPAGAVTFTSRELIENAKLLDGRTVTYRGEAVTAIMDRGDHSWVNVYDGSNAIGVWCEKTLLKKVRFLGDYKNTGDMVRVEGIFNRACAEHGGELDIHAVSVTVLEKGYPVEELVDTRKLNLAIILFLLTLVMVFIFRKKI